MSKYKGTKVLYVGSPPLFSKGASSIHMLKMCQAMDRLKFEVELLLPGYFSKEKLFRYYGITSDFKVRSIPFTELIARQLVHGITSSLYVLLSGEKYDFIITRNLVFCYIACLILKLPVIYDAHHPPVNRIAGLMINSFSNSKSFLGMSFNSKGLYEIYSKGVIDNCNIVVSHNGVDLEDYNKDFNNLEFRNKSNIPAEKKIICYSGNTYPGRGIENLISAAGILDEVFFLVVGGLEKDNSKYKEEINRRGLKNIRIEGFVEHQKVSEYLLVSDILIIPYSEDVTIKDGTSVKDFTSPIKLFEYLAAGKPIIAAELPSICEVLNDTENCLMMKPGDTSDMVAKIKMLLESEKLRTRLSENAKLDSNKYSWEQRVKTIVDKFVNI